MYKARRIWFWMWYGMPSQLSRKRLSYKKWDLFCLQTRMERENLWKKYVFFSCALQVHVNFSDHIRPSSISLPTVLFANHFSDYLSLIFLISVIANDFREFFEAKSIMTSIVDFVYIFASYFKCCKEIFVRYSIFLNSF